MKFRKNCEFLNEEFHFGTKIFNRVDIVFFLGSVVPRGEGMIWHPPFSHIQKLVQ